MSIAISAGTLIGTAGDLKARSYGLDIGARDFRIPNAGDHFANPNRFACERSEANPYDRCYTVCVFDYFAPGITTGLQFSQNGVVRATAPSCGTIYLDLKGAAQGYWFSSANISRGVEFEHAYPIQWT